MGLNNTNQLRTEGFTLIEMLVVIMIMMIIMSITGVMSRNKGSRNIETIGRILMLDIRHVRSIALVRNVKTAITIDVEKNKYYSKDLLIEKSFPDDMSVVITLDEKDISGKKGDIIFYPDGSSSGGKIELKMNGRELKVITSWLNGYVAINM